MKSAVFFLSWIAGALGAAAVADSLRVPESAAIAVTTAAPTLEIDRAGLKALPQQPVGLDAKSIAGRRRALRQLRGLESPPSVSDFYECRSSTPAPTAADCGRVVDEVYGLGGQALIVAPKACLVFQYGTCWGFFCALCDGRPLNTDTDFVAAQLGVAQALCVAGTSNQVGTVVGDGAPQWQAGFVYRGSGLPDYYDVC
ncbi:hypothetical protein GGS23DRAFT_595754 [Durotheca rogersii]|uniref:uncharacterized protein n=1 Tax=Durotheca rogersii TaxID=419775 RepID=UPI002220DFBA|nr:uncharacterized protein GGS23DRAFT_595754 [Durotheca rogersii]KAI5864105.1 hypothetical protein GGS23DRAFT_595754 [Durotheca rogersii]